MNAIRKYNPATAHCRHGLVAQGRVCPQCLWEAAASGDGSAQNAPIRKVYLRAMPLACEAILPPAEREEMWREERRGPWYALQFTVHWVEKQRRAKGRAA